MSCVIVDKTRVQTLVAKALIAMAVARELRQGLGNLSCDRVGVHRLAEEFVGRQCGWKLARFGSRLISRDFGDSRLADTG